MPSSSLLLSCGVTGALMLRELLSLLASPPGTPGWQVSLPQVGLPAILFSRLVRDLLGLKVLLVYYPGHLATAVCFTDNVTGDYISLNNQKYVVCDPTYIGAPVGATMPDMDNSSAKVILLK